MLLSWLPAQQVLSKMTMLCLVGDQPNWVSGRNLYGRSFAYSLLPVSAVTCPFQQGRPVPCTFPFIASVCALEAQSDSGLRLLLSACLRPRSLVPFLRRSSRVSTALTMHCTAVLPSQLQRWWRQPFLPITAVCHARLQYNGVSMIPD